MPRLWHVVGSNLNYAFIINNDTILEKTADGALDVYDAHMNPVKNYRLPAKQFDKAITDATCSGKTSRTNSNIRYNTTCSNTI